MTTTRPALLVLALTLACGGDPGGTSTASQTGTSSSDPSTADPTSGGGPATTGTSGGSDSQGQTSGGSSGVVTTGGPTTSTDDTSGGPDETTSGSTSGTTSGTTSTSSSSGEESSSDGSTGKLDLCEDFKQPNCFKSPCDDGFECKQVPDDCVPSNCTCDPETGLPGACTQDCGGGSCVPMGVSCGCLSDADCVKTSSGCCLCNEGGDEVPAHKDCVDQVMKCDLPPDQVFCPQVFLCTDIKPACQAGVCVLQ
jgi:hypothetical protein